VVWCDTEASQAITLERITKWKLSAERILAPTDEPFEDINLDNTTHRTKILKTASRPEEATLIFDYLSGGHTRDENSPQMLPITKFLATLARDRNIPVILIHHLRKMGAFEEKGARTERIRGSSSIAQLARVIWLIDDPNSADGYKRLSVGKLNIAKKPDPIGYKVDEDGVHFGKTPQPIIKKSALDGAIEFLRELLADGAVEAKEIFETAAEFGIQKRTLSAAKSRLGIRSRREGGKNGKWFWEMA
jgi:hypothetical protein